MKCNHCGEEIPDSKNRVPQLDCPRCIAEKSYRAVLDFQRPFAEGIAKGDVELWFRRAANASTWHVAFLQYRLQAWCGTEIESGWKGKQRLPWALAPRSTCERCKEVIDQMLEGKTAEVA